MQLLFRLFINKQQWIEDVRLTADLYCHFFFLQTDKISNFYAIFNWHLICYYHDESRFKILARDLARK